MGFSNEIDEDEVDAAAIFSLVFGVDACFVFGFVSSTFEFE